jgi:hypothetical protein
VTLSPAPASPSSALLLLIDFWVCGFHPVVVVVALVLYSPDADNLCFDMVASLVVHGKCSMKCVRGDEKPCWSGQCGSICSSISLPAWFCRFPCR